MKKDTAHDNWFRDKVVEALQSTSPSIPHDEVMAKFKDRLRSTANGVK